MDSELATQLWRRKLNLLLVESELPEKFHQPQSLIRRNSDNVAWDFLEEVRSDIVEYVSAGDNIVIISSTVGNGKTSWAARLLQRYLAETALDGRIVVKGKFVVGAALLSKLTDFSYMDTLEFKKWFNDLKNCDLLVIDEVGSGTLNRSSYPRLYELINYRVDNRLSTIYTTNYTDEQLVEELGERLYSRIFDMATVVEFNSTNVRGYDVEQIKGMEGT